MVAETVALVLRRKRKKAMFPKEQAAKGSDFFSGAKWSQDSTVPFEGDRRIGDHSFYGHGVDQVNRPRMLVTRRIHGNCGDV